jgi:hypothetical protein
MEELEACARHGVGGSCRGPLHDELAGGGILSDVVLVLFDLT